MGSPSRSASRGAQVLARDTRNVFCKEVSLAADVLQDFAFNINELFKQRQHLFIKKQVERAKLGQLLTSKGFCSNREAPAAAKSVHRHAIAVPCVFLAPPLQGSQSSCQALL